MTIDKMIEVLQAFREGKQIQGRIKCREDSWNDMVAPTWNFPMAEYRVKPEPRELWLNVYPRDRVSMTYRTKAEADSMARPDRVKCVRLIEPLEDE